MMRWHRIKALLIRHLYLYKRSFPRIMDILFWPIMTLLLWGFLSVYLEETNLTGLNIVTILLGAVILWEFLSESQHSITVGFLEEVWEKNFLNIFVTPLSLSEFIASTALLGVIRVILVGIVMFVVASLAYSFNLFALGIYLIPSIANLLLFGWVLGLLITAIILRFGTSAQVLAFGVMFLVQPFTAVFYPVSILPKFVQYISYALPSTYVFEGMRTTINQGALPVNYILIGLALNVFYFILAVIFFYKMFAIVKNKGKLMKLD